MPQNYQKSALSNFLTRFIILGLVGTRSDLQLHPRNFLINVKSQAAIAASVSLRTRLTLEKQEEKLKLNLINFGISREWEKNILDQFLTKSSQGSEEISGSVTPVNEAIIQQIISIFGLDDCETDSHLHAITAFLYLWIYISKCYNNGMFYPCTVEVESELALGAGMGSSASYSVCLAAGILLLCGRSTPQLLPEDKSLIQEWSFQAERIFHGKPSGLDNAVCLFGGAVLFQNGSVSKKISNLPDIHVLIVDTKVSRNTKKLVEKVKHTMNLLPNVVGSIMDSIEYVSNDCWSLLTNLQPESESADEKLQMLVDTNHHLLNALGVGHPLLDKIQAVASQHSCVAKTTGAGGGGCAIVFIPRRMGNVVALKEELNKCGFGVHDVFLGSPGVQVKCLT